MIKSKENNFGLGELNPKEAGLIYMIRHVYRFGTVEITTQDGIPKQFRKREYTTNIPEGVPEKNPIETIKDAIEYMQELEGLTMGK
jgi:hypothetical protein